MDVCDAVKLSQSLQHEGAGMVFWHRSMLRCVMASTPRSRTLLTFAITKDSQGSLTPQIMRSLNYVLKRKGRAIKHEGDGATYICMLHSLG